MDNYKKFNFSLLFIVPAIFLIYFSSVFLFYFDDKDDSYSIETYFQYKDSIAQLSKQNRILFTSGSNNFLGIRAYQIEHEYTIPTYNLSIHAGLKAPYILERAKRIARSGDIVIVPLEYGNFTDDGDVSIVLNKYLLTYDKEYFKSNFSIVEKLKILSSISILDVFTSITNFDKNVNAIKKNQLLKNLNKNGDMLNMTKSDTLKTKKNPFQLPLAYDIETKGLLAIKNFSRYCKTNKITFFITFPNTIRYKAFESPKYKLYFAFLMDYFHKNDIHVLGEPSDGMYPRDLFFDSEYHLISKGSDIRTKDFIQLINQNEFAKSKIDSISKELKE